MFDEASKDLLQQQWRRFCKTGTADDTVVRDFIFESWQRSRAYGVDPVTGSVAAIDSGTFAQITRYRSNLLRIGLPVIEKLFAFIRGSRSVIILSDEQGIILNRTGDPEYLTNSKNYEPGIDYSEKTVGTNGIGTCLHLGHPVQIWAHEHFCERNQKLSCSAAPIRDADGNLVGCLNLSCLWDKAHAHTLAMVAAAANAIEQQIRLEAVLENKIQLLQEKEGIFQLINDGLLTIDHQLKITDINERARHMLEIEEGKGLFEPAAAYIHSGPDFRRLIDSGIAVYDQDVTLKLRHSILPCILSAIPIKKSAGLVITIREATTVHRMVNRYSGSKAVYTFDDIIGNSPQIRESLRYAAIAGKSNTNTLLLGESGTGKEIFAQAIHNSGDRRRGPFVAVNCGALPRDLIQSELFGYAEGAFTGAKSRGNPGKFELADGGTIFLDEIAEMPLAAQVNLLRVVESKEVVRLGDKFSRPIDVRIIAATNRSLLEAIGENRFREDLYFRLNVLTINLPPLRLRLGDLDILIAHFLKKISRAAAQADVRLADDARNALAQYPWPGNIRELENVIERAVHICRDGIIRLEDLGREVTSFAVTAGRTNTQVPGSRTEMNIPVAGSSLLQSEYRTILSILRENAGNMRKSAQSLGVARSTLYEKIRKYNIDLSEIR